MKEINVKLFSYIVNEKLHFLCLSCIFIAFILSGCYSFTGGTIPPHLKTLNIGNVSDNSGYGNPLYKETLTTLLIDKFRRDNSFTLVEYGGDAKLSITINSIAESVMTVEAGNRGEIENERKITVSCNVEYFDAVNKKVIWNKSFSNYNVYRLTDAQTGRDNAVSKALEQTGEDILMAVVSGW